MPVLPESEFIGQRIVNKDFQVLRYSRMTSRSWKWMESHWYEENLKYIQFSCMCVGFFGIWYILDSYGDPRVRVNLEVGYRTRAEKRSELDTYIWKIQGTAHIWKKRLSTSFRASTIPCHTLIFYSFSQIPLSFHTISKYYLSFKT